MARAHQRVARLPARKIDHTSWDLSQGVFVALSAGSAATTFITAGTAPVTLMRLRGEVLISLDATQAPGAGVQVTWGIHRVPEGTSTTVLTEPFGDPNADWWAYGTVALGYEEAVTDVIDMPTLTAARVVVDGKAMRKIPPDSEFQFVVTNTTTISARAINLSYGLRWLIGF